MSHVGQALRTQSLARATARNAPPEDMLTNSVKNSARLALVEAQAHFTSLSQKISVYHVPLERELVMIVATRVNLELFLERLVLRDANIARLDGILPKTRPFAACSAQPVTTLTSLVAVCVFLVQ